MKANLNLHTALTHCRTARRMGKISGEVQQRTLRRLLNAQGIEVENITATRWGRMMALRASIEREIKPKLDAIRKARYTLLRGNDNMLVTVPARRKQVAAAARASIPPIDPNLNADWWKEQERLESEEKARALKAAYAR